MPADFCGFGVDQFGGGHAPMDGQLVCRQFLDQAASIYFLHFQAGDRGRGACGGASRLCDAGCIGVKYNDQGNWPNVCHFWVQKVLLTRSERVKA